MDLLVRVGRAIYPYRGAFGVPLMVAVLLLYRPRPYPDASCESLRSLVGWSILVLGLTWRVWGVACWFTRDREGVIGGKRLMMGDGPYAYTRNPRYFGNLLMGVGAAALVGQVSVVAFVAVLWLGVHVPIMAAERETLAERFGPVYDAYCRRVPMFWPRFDGSRPVGGQWWPVSWGQGVREEMGTVMGWLCLGLFVEGWRVAHLADTWGGWGPQWKFFILIPVVVALCEGVRSLLPRERFTDDDRPMAP